ncbi:MAG: zincin-like metallopeptidase domain-containing protein, partial [Rhodospirillaceae bacterium]|nr:zincin-like metallopeptidase domain-containing protein [Rhodospirillaceae bacterium]
RTFILRGERRTVAHDVWFNHGGFGSETCACEELRAETAARMTGEQLGVGHKPRHGTAYVSSSIDALESDPKEIRAAAVDGQRMSDWR